jgi:hypothetical protein
VVNGVMAMKDGADIDAICYKRTSSMHHPSPMPSNERASEQKE